MIRLLLTKERHHPCVRAAYCSRILSLITEERGLLYRNMSNDVMYFSSSSSSASSSPSLEEEMEDDGTRRKRSNVHENQNVHNTPRSRNDYRHNQFPSNGATPRNRISGSSSSPIRIVRQVSRSDSMPGSMPSSSSFGIKNRISSEDNKNESSASSSASNRGVGLAEWFRLRRQQNQQQDQKEETKQQVSGIEQSGSGGGGDISALRNAFLNRIRSDREKRQQQQQNEQQQPKKSYNPFISPYSIRNPGPGAFRVRMSKQQQKQQQQQEEEEQQKAVEAKKKKESLSRPIVSAESLRYEMANNNNNKSTNINPTPKKQKQQQKQKQFKKSSSSSEIILPYASKLTLRELSSLIGIGIHPMVKSLRYLGIELQYPNQTLRPKRPRKIRRRVIDDDDDDDNNNKNNNNRRPIVSMTAISNVADGCLDIDEAELLCLELGISTTRATASTAATSFSSSSSSIKGMNQLELAERRLLRHENTTTNTVEEQEEESHFPPRPPIVCIMGHVDHGKTTLMDALRQRAAADNSGGAPTTTTTTKSKKNKKNSKQLKSKKNQSENVAGTEAGGITQTISAFQVPLPSFDISTTSTSSSSMVTFLDTPGHAAFKSMRKSGSSGADIIVLVIAADDGVSTQTIEILDTFRSMAKSSNNQHQNTAISLVIAMTKIDKNGIDIENCKYRIANELFSHGIKIESLTSSTSSTNDYDPLGGPFQLIPVSGITGEGIDNLIEGLSLQSEIMDLRANTDPTSRAEGIVIDARMEHGLGVAVDCIIRDGILKRGDYVLSGGIHGGKVKLLNDVHGSTIQKAMPSQPVRIIGLKSLPKAGDPIVCVESEEIAKNIIAQKEMESTNEEDSSNSSYRAHRSIGNVNQHDIQITGSNSKQGSSVQRVLNQFGLGNDTDDNNDNVNTDTAADADDGVLRIPVIIKADADGTLEAVRNAMIALGNESTLNVVVDPVVLGIGPITTADIRMAHESGASIFCFNLGNDGGGDNNNETTSTTTEGIEVRYHNVIYSLLDDAKVIFGSHFPPRQEYCVQGTALVQAVFDINNKKDADRIAGLIVTGGTLFKDKESSSSLCYYRVLRNDQIIAGGYHNDNEKKNNHHIGPKTIRAKSLRKVKENVMDVKRGEECGIGLDGFMDFEKGDIIECYTVETKRGFL